MAAQFRNADVSTAAVGKRRRQPARPGSARPQPEPRHHGRHAVRLVSATVSVGFPGQLLGSPVGCASPVIAGHHQQRMVNAPPRSMLDKTFRAGTSINPAPPVRLQPVGITEIDRLRAFSSGKRSAFTPVIAYSSVVLPWSTCGSAVAIIIVTTSIKRVSSSRQRRSSQSRPS